MSALEREPRSAQALFLLAVIAIEHDNAAKAAQVLERALSIDPANAEYHAHHARCLVMLKRHEEARAAALHARQLDPQDALTLDTLGVALSHLGEHGMAVQAFERAVALDPRQPGYLYNLATSLQFSGKFAAAEGAYRKCLRRDPEHYRARSALARLPRTSGAPDDVAALEAQLRRSDLSPDAQLHLSHALAKEYEERGEYSRAFERWTRGKLRKLASLAPDGTDESATFETARRAYPASVTEVASGCPSHRPIFILGMPRTGTTLVERILSSHDEVFAAGELPHFSLAAKQLAATPGNRVLDAATLEAAARLDPLVLGESYLRSAQARTGGTPRFTDKMPLNFFYAGLIRRALPNARIVCLRRNPLDACLSNFRQLFGNGDSYYRYAYDILETGRHYVRFDTLMAHWRSVIPDRFHEIQYERLVADPERQARALLDFCGLGWDPRCLRFFENPAPVATASAVQVRSRIHGDSIGRWKHYRQELGGLIHLLHDHGLPLDS